MPLSSCSCPIGICTATQRFESCARSCSSDGEEVRALAVEHVHEDERARVRAARCGPTGASVCTSTPFDAVHHEQRALDDAQRGESVRLEPRVAGRVDQVDLPVLPLDVAERRRQRHLPLLLVLVPVGDRRALLDRAEAVRRAALEEQRLDEDVFPAPRWPTTATFRILLGSGPGHEVRV